MSLNRIAKTISQRYEKEVQRRIRENDWPKWNKYSVEAPPAVFPPVAVPVTVLEEIIKDVLAEEK